MLRQEKYDNFCSDCKTMFKSFWEHYSPTCLCCVVPSLVCVLLISAGLKRHAPSISSETVWYRRINCDDVCSFSCYDHLHQSWAKTLLEYVGICYLLGKQLFKTRSIMSFFAPISGKSPASMKNIGRRSVTAYPSRSF